MDGSDEVAKARIRKLNDDLLRLSFDSWTFSDEVLYLPTVQFHTLLEKVSCYTDFNEATDPNGLHESGSVDMIFPGNVRKTFSWKILYFDKKCEYDSPDPSDESVTTRILSLMAESELPKP